MFPDSHYDCYIAPCAGEKATENLAKSILNGVELTQVFGDGESVPAEAKDAMVVLGDKKIGFRVWGLNRRDEYVERIKKGSFFLFYTGYQVCSYQARVHSKLKSPAVAARIWGDSPTYPWLVFLVDFRQINVPVPLLNAILGYKHTNHPQKFGLLAPKNT